MVVSETTTFLFSGDRESPSIVGLRYESTWAANVQSFSHLRVPSGRVTESSDSTAKGGRATGNLYLLAYGGNTRVGFPSLNL